MVKYFENYKVDLLAEIYDQESFDRAEGMISDVLEDENIEYDMRDLHNATVILWNR